MNPLLHVDLDLLEVSALMIITSYLEAYFTMEPQVETLGLMVARLEELLTQENGSGGSHHREDKALAFRSLNARLRAIVDEG